VKEIGQVIHIETAASLCGVSAKTLRQWLARGAREIRRRESGERPEHSEDTYVGLHRDVQEARAKAEKDGSVSLRDAGRDEWRATATWLERNFPERWAPTKRLNLAVKDELRAFMAKLERNLPSEVFDAVLDAASAEDDGEEE